MSSKNGDADGERAGASGVGPALVHGGEHGEYQHEGDRGFDEENLPHLYFYSRFRGSNLVVDAVRRDCRRDPGGDDGADALRDDVGHTSQGGDLVHHPEGDGDRRVHMTTADVACDVDGRRETEAEGHRDLYHTGDAWTPCRDRDQWHKDEDVHANHLGYHSLPEGARSHLIGHRHGCRHDIGGILSGPVDKRDRERWLKIPETSHCLGARCNVESCQKDD